MKGTAIALLMLGIGLAVLAVTASAAMSISQPKYDSGSFVPGEDVTVTHTGLSTTNQYDLDVQLFNGTVVLSAPTNLTPDSTGKIVWTFAVPADWDGGYIVETRVNSSQNYVDSDFFDVQLFTLAADLDHNVYLPGDTVTIFYFTQRLQDQKPLPAGSGHWKATVLRDNGSGPDIVDPIGASFSAPQGSLTFPLPQGTRPGSYLVTLTYNDTTDKHSENAVVSLSSGTLNVAVRLDRSPAAYAPGSPVVVTITATTIRGGTSESTPGVSITTVVERNDVGNGSWVLETAYTVATQTTGGAGQVSGVFTLAGNIADNTEFRVRSTATKSGATAEASTLFAVRGTQTLLITLELDKTTYKPGDTIHAKLSFNASNTTLVNGAMYLWQFSASSTGVVLLLDYGAGTSTGAEKQYTIPAEFNGGISVTVVVYTPDDDTHYESETVQVFSSALLLNPASPTYAPGDTVTVTIELVSDAIASPTFIYSVTPSSGGDPIKTGTLSGSKTGTVSFVVPTPADDAYTIRVTASGSGQVIQDSTTVTKGKYAVLQITVLEQSYKPGDTAIVHWKLVSVGGATLPPTVDLSVSLSAGGSASSQRFERSGSEGDIPVHIPANADAGDIYISVSAYDHQTGAYQSAAAESFYVRSSAGASPAAGANMMGLAGIGIGIFALVLAIAALAMLMKKPRAPGASMGSSSASSPSSFGELKSEPPKKEHHTSSDDQPKTL